MIPLETVIEHTWPWPLWTAVLGLLVLVAAVLLLYRREPAVVGRGWKVTLLASRLLACILLVWILGGWQRQQHRTEPAQIIVAVDESASMSFVDEFRDPRMTAKLKAFSSNSPVPKQSSGSRIGRFELSRAMLEHSKFGWLKWFNQNYRVKLQLMGDSLREIAADSPQPLRNVQPTRPASKLGQDVRESLAAQQGLPTAAVILFTDGVTTAGPTLSEAAETARRQGIPLYLIGIGGGEPPRDVRLADLVADDVAFAGDAVQLEAQLIADGYQGQKTTVRVKRADNGEVLSEQPITLEKNATRMPIRMTLRPQTTGQIPLVMEASPMPGESDVNNNRLTHALLVNDVTIKVLLIQAYPSYEYRFLKNLLSRATRTSDSSAKSFELTTVLQEADREHAEQDATTARLFPVKREDLYENDVVLFGDVDPTLLGRATIENLVAFVRERGGSVVFMAGPQFTPQAYRDTALAQLFPFQFTNLTTPASGQFTEPFRARLTAVGALNPACQLENLAADNAALWSALPELYWHVEIHSLNPGARVLVDHPSRTTSDRRPLPLMMTQYVGAGRVVFHATDETYRWGRFHGSDEYYSRYWLQMLRSLSRSKLLAGQSSAEVTTDRQQYVGGEEVQLRVRFRQERADLDNVSVTLEHSNGVKQLVSVRRKTPDSSVFSAEVRDLAAGSYRISLASPLLNPSPAPRSFTVANIAQEQIGVPQNVADMQQAAKISGGKYYDWFNTDRIFRELPRGQRVRVESLPPEPIWNSPLVAALFVAILSVEWLVRKRVGML